VNFHEAIDCMLAGYVVKFLGSKSTKDGNLIPAATQSKRRINRCVVFSEINGEWVESALVFDPNYVYENTWETHDTRIWPKREWPDVCHESHKSVRSSDASTFDFICDDCGATDRVTGGWGALRKPCKG